MAISAATRKPGRRACRRPKEKKRAPTKEWPAATNANPSTGSATAAKLRPGKVRLREQSLLDRGMQRSLPPTKRPRAARARIRHLERVAAWSSANVPPLGAFVGARLAALCEAEGQPPSGATLGSTCRRCESFLRVGVNLLGGGGGEFEGEEKARGGGGEFEGKEKRKGKGKGNAKGKGKDKICANLVYDCQYCKHRHRRAAARPKKRAQLKGKGRTPAPAPGLCVEDEREGNEVVSPTETQRVASIRDSEVAKREAKAGGWTEVHSTAAAAAAECTSWKKSKKIASRSVKQVKAIRTPCLSLGNLLLPNVYCPYRT